MRAVIALTLGCAVATLATAQPVRTPKVGSAERTAILDAIRVPVEKAVKVKVKFSVKVLRVSGNWAFFMGRPLQKNGRPIDYSKTQYREAIAEGAFDDGAMALLKREKGRWRILDWGLGMTDYPAGDWVEKRKAPKAILPSF